MRLVKYSRDPLVFDPTWDYDNLHEIANAVGKPRGFWLSDDDDWGWRYWCEAEDWNMGGLAHATEFRLTPGHNVLLITTYEEFEAFGNEYRVPAYPGLAGVERLEAIDWARVRDEYDGIVISPYQNERRFDLVNFWYAGWDVASACIWNLDAIEPVPCGEVQNHRDVTVVCAQPAGHESGEDGRARVHRGESYGTTVMWLGEQA